MVKKLFLLLLTASAAFAQAPVPSDLIAPELKLYLKLDAAQIKSMNSLIGGYYSFAGALAADYLDLEDQIDSLRKDTTKDPQAIGLAIADPTAAEIIIERKIDAKIIETEKAVQATLSTTQRALVGQLSAALGFFPLIGDAFDAFVLSESERPSNSALINRGDSPLSLRAVFPKKLAAVRAARAVRSQNAR